MSDIKTFPFYLIKFGLKYANVYILYLVVVQS